MFHPRQKYVITREITRLLDVGFIKEVYHPNWLANHVCIPKKNKDWRMCVDYIDLNKACKKYSFGLPQVDQVVDSMMGCSLQASWIVTRCIIRFPSRSKIRSRRPSSLHLVHFVIQQCHSDSKVQGQCTKVVYKSVYIVNSGATLKLMLMTWSSRLRKINDSSLT
jgi:hypothetical protein